jgi:hypothetical protein
MIDIFNMPTYGIFYVDYLKIEICLHYLLCFFVWQYFIMSEAGPKINLENIILVKFSLRLTTSPCFRCNLVKT